MLYLYAYNIFHFFSFLRPILQQLSRVCFTYMRLKLTLKLNAHRVGGYVYSVSVKVLLIKNILTKNIIVHKS